MSIKYYKTYAEASRAARQWDIRTAKDYRKYRELDERLPPFPEETYSDDWRGFKHFLGTEKYKTYAEASAAAQKLGFKTRKDYLEGYTRDRRLRISPGIDYPDDWKGFKHFLGMSYYATYAEAAAQARKHGFDSKADYKRMRKHFDPRLPPCPDSEYESEWEGWPHFLQNKAV